MDRFPVCRIFLNEDRTISFVFDSFLAEISSDSKEELRSLAASIGKKIDYSCHRNKRNPIATIMMSDAVMSFSFSNALPLSSKSIIAQEFISTIAFSLDLRFALTPPMGNKMFASLIV